MTKTDFWKRFESTYPKDQETLKEILPFKTVESLVIPANEYALYSWLASFFRDAIEYGRENPQK
jgi:hypothetical protein